MFDHFVGLVFKGLIAPLLYNISRTQLQNASKESKIKKMINEIVLKLLLLTLKDPFISKSCIEIKIELNFYFHTSLWCLKRFYEGLKALSENKNLT